MNLVLFAWWAGSLVVVLTLVAASYYLWRYRKLASYNNTAVAYIHAGMHDNAIELLQHALALDSEHALTNYNLGYALYFGKKAHAPAEERFRRALESDNTMASAWYALGHLLYHARGEGEESAGCLKRALAINRRLPEVFNTLGFMAIGRGDWGEAIVMFREAVELDGSYDAGWCNLAIASLNQGRTADAIRAGIEYVRAQNGSALAHSNMGNIYGACGRLNNALVEFGESLKIDPGNWLVHFWNGCVLLQMQQFSRAGASFFEALRLHGEFALAHYNLALAFENLGRPDLAHTHIERSIELDPQLGNGLLPPRRS